MNMKKIFFYSAATVFVCVVLSCDKINAPYTVTSTVSCADVACSFPTDANPVYRKVLVEDVTGHLCGNCPAAALILYGAGGLKEQYGDTLISMGVHASDAGQFTEPNRSADRGQVVQVFIFGLPPETPPRIVLGMILAVVTAILVF